jgi:hypothetical protein
MGIGAAIGGVASAAGSIFGSNAQSNSAQNAQNINAQMFGTIQGNMQPYIGAGSKDLGTLQSYLNARETGGPGGGPGLLHQFGAQDLNANMAPNYAFQLGQGQGALANQNAATGGAGGGNAFAGEQAYTQNTAASAYQNAFNNYNTNQQNIYSRLGNLAQLGQSAGTNSALGGSAFGANEGNAAIGVGNAQAAGYTGVANAINGTVGNLAGYNLAQQYLNGPGQYNATTGAGAGSGYGQYANTQAPANPWGEDGA